MPDYKFILPCSQPSQYLRLQGVLAAGVLDLSVSRAGMPRHRTDCLLRVADNCFTQQELPAWRPLLTPTWVRQCCAVAC